MTDTSLSDAVLAIQAALSDALDENVKVLMDSETLWVLYAGKKFLVSTCTIKPVLDAVALLSQREVGGD